MKFISEEIIDQQSEKISSDPVSQVKMIQPVLAAYVFSDSFSYLLPEEQDYFLYLSLVICKSFLLSNKEVNNINKDYIEATEEKIGLNYLKQKGTNFRDRITPFFDNYPQEDLLAFIEDSLTYDTEDENILSKEGRDLVFIGLKTILDTLIFAAKK